MKKILLMLLSFGLVSLSSMAFAEHCPSVTELKTLTKNNVNGWMMYSIDEEGEPLTNAQAKEFAQKVKHFTLAEYDEDAPEGAAACYYSGTVLDGNYLGVYLAKPGLAINKNDAHWKVIPNDPGSYDCRTSTVTSCTFVSAH